MPISLISRKIGQPGTVRKRLYLAFFWLALLILLFTLFALKSFNQFAEAVDTTTQGTIPTLTSIHSLTGEYTLLSGYASLYTASHSEKELQKHVSSSEKLRAAINSNISSLQNYMGKKGGEELTDLSIDSLESLESIEQLTRQRILLQDRLQLLSERVQSVHNDLLDTVSPIVYASISMGHHLGNKTKRRNAEAITNLFHKHDATMARLTELRISVGQLALLISMREPLSQKKVSTELLDQQESLTGQISTQLTALTADGHMDPMASIIVASKNILDLGDLTHSPEVSVPSESFSQAVSHFNRAIIHHLQAAEESFTNSLGETLSKNKESVDTLLNTIIRDIQAVMNIKSESNYLISILNAAIEGSQSQSISEFTIRYNVSLQIFQNAIHIFQKSALAKRNPILSSTVNQISNEFVSFSEREIDIFELCRERLAVKEKIQTNLSENRQISRQERILLKGLVQRASADTNSLQKEMAEKKQRSSLVLILMSLSSLITFFFVTYFTLNILTLQKKNLAANKEVRREKEYTDNIITSLLDALLVVTPDGTILRVNATLCSLLDYSEKQLIGQQVSVVVANKELFVRSILHKLAQGETCSNQDVDYLTRDAIRVPVLLNGSMMKDKTGELQAIILIARDMRESNLVNRLNRTNKELQQEIFRRESSERMLQESYDQLEEKVAERTGELQKTYQQLAHAGRLTSLGEMATGIAHEINQPLNIIGLAATVIQRDLARITGCQPRTSEAIGKIQDQVKRTATIINNMRSFARARQDDLRAIDLGGSVSQALSFFREQFRLHQIELMVEMAENMPPVKVDSQKFEQVVINLLSNARYAVDEKEKMGAQEYHKTISIALFLETEANALIFEVRDNGRGLTKEEKERCMEPFFTTKTVGKGTGLGLSISHTIVNEFNGSMEIESEKGGGATFRICIPVDDTSLKDSEKERKQKCQL